MIFMLQCAILLEFDLPCSYTDDAGRKRFRLIIFTRCNHAMLLDNFIFMCGDDAVMLDEKYSVYHARAL